MLISRLNELGEAAWLTPQGRWSIHQATRNWHGVGPRSFAAAVANWRQRYQGLDTVHHTEELCYQDVCEGGFFTITADLAANETREIWRCEISVQLTGIPLDSTPFRHLARLVNVTHPLYFRPRVDRAVDAQPLYRDLIYIDPVGYVIDDEHRDQKWVCGIIAPNPFHLAENEHRVELPDWLPGYIDGSELLVCALRQWHPLDYPSCDTGSRTAMGPDLRRARLPRSMQLGIQRDRSERVSGYVDGKGESGGSRRRWCDLRCPRCMAGTTARERSQHGWHWRCHRDCVRFLRAEFGWLDSGPQRPA